MKRTLITFLITTFITIVYHFTLPPDPEGSGILSGFFSLMTQTAAMTSLTPDGGFFIVLTTAISEG